MKAQPLRLRRLLVPTLLVSVVSLSACSELRGRQDADMAMQAFDSVESLTARSQRIVVGVVDGPGRPSVDYGTDRDANGKPINPGVPVVVYDLAVERDLIRSLDASRTISVVYPANTDSSDGATPLSSGQRVVLFLAWFPKTGVDGLQSAYVPISYDNGVLDVTPTGAVARSAALTSVTRDGAAQTAGKLRLGIDELSAAVSRFSQTTP